MLIPRRRQRDTFLPWAQLVLDCASIQIILHLAFYLRFRSQLFHTSLAVSDYPVYFKAFNFIMVVLVFFIRFYGLYRPARLMTFTQEAWRVIKAVAACVIVVMALTFFIRGFTFSRTFLVAAGLVLALGVSMTRFLLGVVVMTIDRVRGSLRNILILGCDDNAKRLSQFYRRNPRLSVRVVAFLDDRLAPGTVIDGVPVLGPLHDLKDVLRRTNFVHEVVLAAPGLSMEQVLEIIYECEKVLVSFRWIADIFGLIASKMNVAYFGGVPLLSFVDSPLGDWESRVLKRSMDLVLSTAALIVLSPFFILLALWIKMDSKGPVFYGQRRIGQDGREFLLYKFRTMQVDAESATGPVWAKEGDPRRTKVGAVLRRINVDELPQLWNVLVGQMSLVGPRPERPFFVSQFKEDIPRYMARHSIRSGMTGWAQVNGLRGNTSIEERTKYDLYYIENWSLFLDLKILFMTLTTLLTSRNAY